MYNDYQSSRQSQKFQLIIHMKIHESNFSYQEDLSISYEPKYQVKRVLHTLSLLWKELNLQEFKVSKNIKAEYF